VLCTGEYSRDFFFYKGHNQSRVVSADRTIDRKKSKFTGNVLSQGEEEKSKKKTNSISKKKE
jgi:hypothetical protein